jgi:hypothetical protein
MITPRDLLERVPMIKAGICSYGHTIDGPGDMLLFTRVWRCRRCVELAETEQITARDNLWPRRRAS